DSPSGTKCLLKTCLHSQASRALTQSIQFLRSFARPLFAQSCLINVVLYVGAAGYISILWGMDYGSSLGTGGLTFVQAKTTVYIGIPPHSWGRPEISSPAIHTIPFPSTILPSFTLFVDPAVTL